MADGDLILDVDWDISKAEAKQRKLNRELEISQTKASAITKKTKELEQDLAEEARVQKEIKEILKQQVAEASELSQKIDNVKNGTASITQTIDLGPLDLAEQKLQQMEAEIRDNETALERSLKDHKKITDEISKQDLKLQEQNAKTQKIADDIGANSQNQENFNKTIGNGNTALNKFGKRIKELVKSAFIFTVITKALNAMKNALGNYLKENSKLSGGIAKLKGNLAVIGAVFKDTISPIIEWVIEKFVQLTTFLAVVLAKALKKDINEMVKFAESTKKAGNEAKKATAGFDTLQTIDTSSDNGEVEIDTSQITAAAEEFYVVTEEIEKKTNELDEVVGSAADNIAESGVEAFEKNKPAFKRAWEEFILPIGEWAWADFKDVIGRFGEGVSKIIAVFSTDDFATVINGVISILTVIWSVIKGGLNEAKTIFSATFDFIAGILGGFIKIIAGIFNVISGIFQFFVGLITWVAGVFTGNTEKMEKGAAKMGAGLKKILNGVIKIFAGVVNVLSSIVNWVWEHIVGAFRGIVNGIGGLVGSMGKLLGFENWGWEWNFKTPTIPQWHPPELANGAVIPGGSPFLAWLGDQPKGQTNIEAPLDTIVEAFKVVSGNQKIEINFTGSLAQLGRVLAPEISTENNRASAFAKG